MIISIDGADCLGKTTQAKLLAERIGATVINYPYFGEIVSAAKSQKRFIIDGFKLKDVIEQTGMKSLAPLIPDADLQILLYAKTPIKTEGIDIILWSEKNKQYKKASHGYVQIFANKPIEEVHKDIFNALDLEYGGYFSLPTELRSN